MTVQIEKAAMTAGFKWIFDGLKLFVKSLIPIFIIAAFFTRLSMLTDQIPTEDTLPSRIALDWLSHFVEYLHTVSLYLALGLIATGAGISPRSFFKAARSSIGKLILVFITIKIFYDLMPLIFAILEDNRIIGGRLAMFLNQAVLILVIFVVPLAVLTNSGPIAAFKLSARGSLKNLIPLLITVAAGILINTLPNTAVDFLADLAEKSGTSEQPLSLSDEFFLLWGTKLCLAASFCIHYFATTGIFKVQSRED